MSRASLNHFTWMVKMIQNRQNNSFNISVVKKRVSTCRKQLILNYLHAVIKSTMLARIPLSMTIFDDSAGCSPLWMSEVDREDIVIATKEHTLYASPNLC